MNKKTRNDESLPVKFSQSDIEFIKYCAELENKSLTEFCKEKLLSYRQIDDAYDNVLNESQIIISTILNCLNNLFKYFNKLINPYAQYCIKRIPQKIIISAKQILFMNQYCLESVIYQKTYKDTIKDFYDNIKEKVNRQDFENWIKYIADLKLQ